MKIQPGESHEKVTELKSSVVLTVGHVVLEKKQTNMLSIHNSEEIQILIN